MLSVNQSLEVLCIQHCLSHMTLVYILKYLFVDIYRDINKLLACIRICIGGGELKWIGVKCLFVTLDNVFPTYHEETTGACDMPDKKK